MEICDTLNVIFRNIIPVIDHPGCKNISYREEGAANMPPGGPFEGVIKVTAIDRSKPFNLSAKLI